MATAPPPLVLRREDFQDAGAAWLERLFRPLNEQFDSIRTALGRGLSRSENLRSAVKTITFTVGTWPVVVNHGLSTRPTDAWVGRLRRTDNGAISAPWSFSWGLDANSDMSATFQGLVAGVTYEARILVE